MKMHQCVYGCYFLRLVGGFLLYLGQIEAQFLIMLLNVETKHLYLQLLFIPFDSQSVLGVVSR